VGLILLWLAFRKTNFTNLGEGLREAKYIWLFLSIFFALLAYISRARRWILLINPLGYKPSLKNAFYAMMTGYLANMALPESVKFQSALPWVKRKKYRLISFLAL